MTEQQIQSNIIKRLELQGYYVVKLIKTNKNGIPDILAIKDGKARFIEVKKKQGVLSELQKEVINQLKNKGCEVDVWTAYNEDFSYAESNDRLHDF